MWRKKNYYKLLYDIVNQHNQYGQKYNGHEKTKN